MEDEEIKRIYVNCSSGLDRKRRQVPSTDVKELVKKLKTNCIELEDSDSSGSSDDSSNDYTFRPKHTPTQSDKSTETVISSSSDAPGTSGTSGISKDSGINIINIEVIQEADKNIDILLSMPVKSQEEKTPSTNDTVVII